MPNVTAILQLHDPTAPSPPTLSAEPAFDNKIVVSGLSAAQVDQIDQGKAILMNGAARRSVFLKSAVAYRIVGQSTWTVAIELNESVFDAARPNGPKFADLLTANGNNVLNSIKAGALTTTTTPEFTRAAAPLAPGETFTLTRKPDTPQTEFSATACTWVKRCR